MEPHRRQEEEEDEDESRIDPLVRPQQRSSGLPALEANWSQFCVEQEAEEDEESRLNPSEGPEWLLLPDCLLLKIFSWLDFKGLFEASQVCLDWNRVAADYTLKRRLDTRSLGPLNVGHIRRLVTFANKHLLELKVKGSLNQDELHLVLNKEGEIIRAPVPKTLTRKVMGKMRNRCENLRVLEIENVSNYGLRLEDLPENLVHMAFRGCEVSPDKLLSQGNNRKRRPGVRKLFQGLRCLDISYSTDFESTNCDLLNEFTSLQYLYMEGLFRVNNGGAFWLNADFFASLKVLDMEGTDVSDESLVYMLLHCKDLTELYLGKTSVTLNKGVIDYSLFARCSGLSRLCMINAPVSLQGIKVMAKSFPSLNWINVGLDIYEEAEREEKRLESLVFELPFPGKTCLHYNHHQCV